jgi:hypothetical protein
MNEEHSEKRKNVSNAPHAVGTFAFTGDHQGINAIHSVAIAHDTFAKAQPLNAA